MRVSRINSFSLLLPETFWILALSVTLFGETQVCGVIQSGTDWTRSQSPYIVTQDIYIPPTSRLTIEPGVTVIFQKPQACRDTIKQLDWSDSSYTGIKVDGAFFVLGTEDDPVIFQAQNFKQGLIAWDGIRFRDRGFSVVEIGFAEFRGAHRAISAIKSEFGVHHCLFEGNNVGINLGDRANLVVVNNNFHRNLSAAIYIDVSVPKIVNNIFSDNLNNAIWSDSRSAMLIKHNGFWNNREGNCFRCPHEVLKMKRVNDNKDSVDAYGNLVSDPVFINSQSYNNFEKKDITLDTPSSQVQDSSLAKIEKESRIKWLLKRKRSQSKEEPYQALGKGSYVISKYSRLKNAGDPWKMFNDRDGTPNDLGLHGGPMGRMTVNPY